MKMGALEISCLSEKIAHKEETETTYKAIIGNERHVMIIFVGTIQNDANDGKEEHYGLPML